MTDVAEQLLEWSSRLVDEGRAPDGATTQPMDARLADFGDGLALVASFSHVVVLRGPEGLTLVDTSSEAMAGGVQASLRRWSPQPVDTIVYTHGHMDHVGGAPRFAEEALTMGAKAPRVVAHDAVAGRFTRYEETDGFNARINARQFGRIALMQAAPERWSIDWVWPTETYAERLEIELAGTPAVLHHDRGETDDHTWVWLPERRAILRRGLRHLGVPQRRQPTEGPALPGRVGPGSARHGRARPRSSTCRPTASRSRGATGSAGCSPTSPALSSPWSTRRWL